MTAEQILFPPFRLDLASERLWRDTRVVPLRPKTFAILRYLAEHPGRLITNEELLDAVWPGTIVGETMPRLCIREIRQALGDDAKQPRFIETQPRRGYRWIGETRGWRLEASLPSPQVSNLKSQASSVVGREAELAQLHGWLEKALNGQRQIVFVTGEPGIGKTTLIEAFLFGVRSREEFGVQNSEPRTLKPEQPSTPKLWLGWGQCVEQ